MNEKFSVEKLFVSVLVLIPILYIILGWYIGLNYGCKSLIFGPYPDVPMAVRTGLMGSSLEDISGAKAIMTVVPLSEAKKGNTGDAAYYRREGYFEVPGTWKFVSSDLQNIFTLTGRFSRAICHDNRGRAMGSLSVKELNDFLMETGRTKDIAKLKPYLVFSRLEDKYPYLYSKSVLLSNAMGHMFKDNMLPYDVLGLVALAVLIIALMLRSFSLWMYYLYWVAAYWFARIGYHDPTLAFTNQGWHVIFWSFWHGFILDEGRVFLISAVILSIPLFGIVGFIYLVKHVFPRKRREMEDFLKVDRDIKKRKELSIETVEFERVCYDINKKLTPYALTDKYFLGLSDENKDIVVPESMLAHHLHILGPTGSGKTSLVILPLAKQAIDKARGACFIDFKGDDVFKKYVQEKAKEKGKKFYYFSIDPNEPSVGYNPLSSGDIYSKVDRIMAALELIYHGPAVFYSNVQTKAFIELLKEMTEEKREINFLSVKLALEDQNFLERTDVTKEEVKGLLAAMSWIAGIEAINRDCIDLSKIIKDGDIVFFALKSQVNTRLAEAIGKMLIIDIKSQAVARKETDNPYFIFIDEFQNLACSHFVDVISKVRSACFCLVLSNQSRGNLSSVSPAFENAIFTNTSTKVIFMQEDPFDARFWSDKTGKTTYHDKTIVQVDAMGKGKGLASLDGLRSAQGTIHTAIKNYISENVFLKLPFSKSVIFSRGELATIANHEFLFDKKERDRIVSMPFEYDEPSIGAVKEEGEKYVTRC